MFSFVSEMEGEGIYLLRRGEEEGNSLFASKKEEEGRFCFRELRRMFFFVSEMEGEGIFLLRRGEEEGNSLFASKKEEEGLCFVSERGRRVILLVVDQQAAFLYRGLCGVIMGRRVILLHFRQSDRR